ncbi:MAG: lytic murein transglycosylase [Proteobacteria bacterium]|nr:lytic murein transglycosylase [Pseudomonadota bacterium]
MSLSFAKVLILLIVLVQFCYPESGNAQDGRFPPQSLSKVRHSLIHQLTREGFDPSFVYTLLHDKRWELSLLVLEKNLVYRESKANYLHFLDTYSTTRARRFLEENRAFLEKTEKEYGVEKEVIVAILLVESSLGRHAEKHRVFNSLSSLSQANHPDVFRLTFKHLKESYPSLTEDYLRRRAKSKSRWAFQELKAFIDMGIRENLDLLEVKGSWAGAFGLPQFIPTSYLTYGADGDGDNSVHLHNRFDAIASVANYLRAHGWKPKLSEKEMLKILFRYNRSRIYGETVLKSARKLAGGQTTSGVRPSKSSRFWG